MPYYEREQLEAMGFRHLGVNVKLSVMAIIYDCDLIELGDNSRVDDFCVLSGNICIGKHCHVTPMCLLAGGTPGIYLSDFCTLAYGTKVFAQSDDYSGLTLTNSTIPKKYKKEVFRAVRLEKHVIAGASSVILPGVTVAEGCAIGAGAVLLNGTEPWGIYAGVPARRIKDRLRGLLDLEKLFIDESEQ